MDDWSALEKYRDEDGFVTLVPRHPIKKHGSNRNLFAKSLSNEIVLRHGHIAITNYHMGDNREFEKSLSVWDAIYFKYRLMSGYYVEELNEFRIGRGYDLHRLTNFFPGHSVRVDNDAFKADNIDIDLYTGPRDDYQKAALTFTACQGQYSNNSRYTQLMLELQAGSGKTFLAIATIAFYQKRCVIFVPFTKLLDQWKDSFEEYTNIKEKEILVVKGSDMCEKIRRGKYDGVKVFIFSVDTVASYQKRYGDLKTMDMLERTHAYVKVIDECHKDMKTISMIEALSNYRLNLYLSASPGRAEKKEEWIFSTVFKNVPKFGEKFQTQEEMHVNMMVKKYYWTPDSYAIRSMVSARTGLNTKAYETELMNAKPKSFEDSIGVICGWMKSIIKPGKKILFMAQTVAMLGYLQELIEQHFPGETAIYYGGMKPKDKETALEARVIIGTSSSLGTGADIKGLQFNWNVGTYANKIDANQFSGRTRAMIDAEVVYGEFVNFGWLKTARQFEKRKPFLLKKAKNGKIMFVN